MFNGNLIEYQIDSDFFQYLFKKEKTLHTQTVWDTTVWSKHLKRIPNENENFNYIYLYSDNVFFSLLLKKSNFRD